MSQLSIGVVLVQVGNIHAVVPDPASAKRKAFVSFCNLCPSKAELRFKTAAIFGDASYEVPAASCLSLKVLPGAPVGAHKYTLQTTDGIHCESTPTMIIEDDHIRGQSDNA